NMRSRAVATRNEGCLLFLDGLKGFGDVRHALDTCRITLGANEDEIIVHNWEALYAVAFGEEILFGRFCVHEYDIRIAPSSGIESLTCALSDNLYVDSGLGCEQRQDVPKQSRILRRCRGGHYDRFVLRMSRRSTSDENQCNACNQLATM